MITLTITSENDEPFTVRFQTKAAVGEDGPMTWRDSEVANVAGKSQVYGIDENFRIIVESCKPDQPAGHQ